MFLKLTQRFYLLNLKYLRYLLPRARTGAITSDLFYLFLLIAFQLTILPSLFNKMTVDLVTPWLVYHFVILPPFHAFILGLIAAISLENHGATPAGLYICIYLIIGVLLVLVKQHISWRNFFPWVTTFCLTEVWISLFEGLLFFIKGGFESIFGFKFIISFMLKIIFAGLFGIYLITYFGTNFVEE